jgi:hypothetical protein
VGGDWQGVGTSLCPGTTVRRVVDLFNLGVGGIYSAYYPHLAVVDYRGVVAGGNWERVSTSLCPGNAVR